MMHTDIHGASRLVRAARACWPYAAVLLVGAALLTTRLGDFGLWDPWEPKYAQSAREMVERESLFVPYFLDEVRLAKPILTYWGVMLGYLVFGINELGARAVGAGFAIVSMVAVFYAVSTMRGRDAGLLAAGVLVSSPQFLFLARQAMPEVYLFTGFGCGMLFLGVGLFGPERRRAQHFALAGLALGLAVLAKGPLIVGTLTLVPLLVYFLLHPAAAPFWRSRLPLYLLAGALVLGALASLAFLFGTSSNWWGYSEAGRARVAALRDELSVTLAGLDRLWLGLLAVLCAFAAMRARSQGRSRQAAVLILATLVALTAMVTLGQQDRILVGSLLGIGCTLWLLHTAVFAFLDARALLPGVKATLRPYIRPVLLCVGVFLVVIGPWHAAIFMAQDSGFFTDFVIKHNLGRVGENVSRSGVSESYLPVVLYGYFPWTALLPIALVGLVPWWRSEGRRRHGFELLLLLTSVVTLVAFNAAATRFPHYIAPMLIPLCAVLGMTFQAASERRSLPGVLGRVTTAALFVPLMLMLVRRGGSEHLLATFTVKQQVYSDAAPGSAFTVVLWSMAVLWVVWSLLPSRWIGWGLTSVAVVFGGYLTTVFIPRVSPDKSVRALCEAWRQQEPKEPICLWGDVKFGVYFYTDRQVIRLGDQDEFLEFMRPERRALCIVQRNRITRARRRFLTIYPGHDLHLVEGSHRRYATLANYREGPD